MNRRTFVRRVAEAAVLVTAAPLMVPESPKLLARGPIPPFTRCRGTWVINPEWRNAEYEISILIDPGYCGASKCIDPWPARFHTAEDAAAWMKR